uniref:Uncharacterized protein n=1 Tax=Klebsiella pneumoniae TaxID=573 RepID=A0A2U8T267_KLEPN|nr:Hypothetical protein [Klebsiella pneumoniae]
MTADQLAFSKPLRYDGYLGREAHPAPRRGGKGLSHHGRERVSL